MILVKHWNTLPGEGVDSSLLGLEEQDRQASVKNGLWILSCLAARYGLVSSCLISNGSVHTQAVWSLFWILLGIYVSLSCPFFAEGSCFPEGLSVPPTILSPAEYLDKNQTSSLSSNRSLSAVSPVFYGCCLNSSTSGCCKEKQTCCLSLKKGQERTCRLNAQSTQIWYSERYLTKLLNIQRENTEGITRDKLEQTHFFLE